MSEPKDLPATYNSADDEPPKVDETTRRDVSPSGRDLLAAGRGAVRGDVGAARAFLAGALGSDDPAVRGEAVLALGEAEAAAAGRRATEAFERQSRELSVIVTADRRAVERREDPSDVAGVDIGEDVDRPSLDEEPVTQTDDPPPPEEASPAV